MSFKIGAICAVFCLFVLVFVVCDEDLDRRDVHRIVLKPDRPRKPHKQTKKHIKPPHHKSHSYHHDHRYEPQAHATNYYSDDSRETSREMIREYPHYHNHHNHYRDPAPHSDEHHGSYHYLMKPKPPKHENFIINYPEEMHAPVPTKSHYAHPNYVQNDDESNYQHSNYDVPNDVAPTNYRPNNYKQLPAEWRPIPTQSNQILQNPHMYDYTSSSNIHSSHSSPTGGKKKKKPHRKTTDKPKSFAEIIDITTSKPQKNPRPIVENYYNSQDHVGVSSNHYVNYNHNNKSLVKYEVNNINNNNINKNNNMKGNKNKNPSNHKMQHSYEVYEDVEDSKPPKNAPYQNLGPIMNLNIPYNTNKVLPTFTSIADIRVPRNRTKVKNNNNRGKSKQNRLVSTQKPFY